MGSMCQSAVPQLGQIHLLGSDLMISQNLNAVINQRKQDLRISAYPIERPNDVTKTSLILVVSKKTSPELLVRFYLIYSFYINKYVTNNNERSKYQQRFYELTKISHSSAEDQEKVQKFKAQFQKQKNDVKKDLIVLNNLFTTNFIIENINKIPLFTNDPKDIGHLIFPITRLFRGIKKNHQASNLKRKDTIFIVATLKENEQKLLESIQSKAYFSFSIFMRGFTNEQFANDKRKLIRKVKSQSKVYLFRVNFPFKYQKMESAYDNGYYIYPNADQAIRKQGDVVFNIMNTFKIDTSTIASKQIDLQYGYLPYLYRSKHVDRNLSGEDSDLIKIFQLCNAVSRHYLKSQSFLFRIIGGKSDSISISNAILQRTSTIKTTNPTNDIERQNLINNLLDDRNYSQALSTSQKGQSFMLKAKQLEVLYEQNQFEKASSLLGQLNKSPAKTDSKNSQANQIIQYINARLQMRQKRFKTALKRLQELQKTMKKRYGDDYQFIGRDVILSIEQCYRKGQPRNQKDDIISPVEWSIKSTNLHLRSITII